MELQKDRLLYQMIQTLREALGTDLKYFILFGSRARGDYASDSDYDCLLVVSEVTPSLLTTIDEISGEFLFAHDVVFSIIPISEARYLTDIHHPLLKNVAEEGVIL